MLKILKKKYIQFFVCKHEYEKVKTIPTFEDMTSVMVNGEQTTMFKAFDKFKCKKCDRIKYGDYYFTNMSN